MRALAAILACAALGSCTTANEPYRMDPRDQQELTRLLAGKVAGPPVSCLPTYNANDMRIIDGRNVAFRVGTQQVYLMHLTQGCHALGTSGYALLTRQFGGFGMCQGDIAHVVDTSAGLTVGSCGIEQIVPYRLPR